MFIVSALTIISGLSLTPVLAGPGPATWTVKSGAPASSAEAQNSGVITNRTVGKKVFSDKAIELRSEDCHALMRHEPADDVTYRPEPYGAGQGTQAGPDIAPGPDFSDRARNFDLPIRVDLDRRLSRRPDGSRRPFGAEGVVGVIEVREGRAYFDGEPLDGDEVRRMRDACVAGAAKRREGRNK